MQDTMTAALARAVAEAPDFAFLDIGGETYTFRAFDQRCVEVAHGLVAAGVGKGDPVSCLMDNCIELLITWFAVNRIGGIFAPVNAAFKGAYLETQINDTAPAVVVVQEDYAERLIDIVGQLPSVNKVFVAGAKKARQVAAIRFQPFEELRTGNFSAIPDETTPDQAALIIYTSGTTGPSKGCVLPHNMMCNSANRIRLGAGFPEDEVFWNCLPLFHANAMLTFVNAVIGQRRLAVGGRFSVSNFWPDIERTGATVVYLLGSMTNLLATAPDNESAKKCFGQIKRLIAVPFSKEDAAIWRERFGVDSKGASGFGMTEAPSIAGTPPGMIAPIGCAGRGGVDFEVQLLDDSDTPVPTGQVGEISCRPLRPNIMFKGYWRRPEATVQAWRNLWFHTGDLARFDEDGWMYFVDRKKDYIRRRGENISTMEVERVFMSHGGLTDVAVHAVKTPAGDEEVKVTAERAPGSTLTEEELCRWSIEKLPYFVVPLYIEFRDALPRSATGKVLKEQLRQEGKTPKTWDREAAGVTFSRR